MTKSRHLLLLAALELFMLLSACAGYVPGEKARWDNRIREMCARDGGVTVYERVQLPRSAFTTIPGGYLTLDIPLETRAPTTVPYVLRIIDTRLHEYSPEVMRSETQVVRTSDKKILGKSIEYWRRGGDFPTGIAQDSSFGCPEGVHLIDQIFRVEGDVQ